MELNVPVGTYKQFCWNTVEILQKSENHLKAIVGRREVAEGDGVGQCRNMGMKNMGRRKGGENRRSRLAVVGGEWQLHRVAGSWQLRIADRAAMGAQGHQPKG